MRWLGAGGRFRCSARYCSDSCTQSRITPPLPAACSAASRDQCMATSSPLGLSLTQRFRKTCGGQCGAGDARGWEHEQKAALPREGTGLRRSLVRPGCTQAAQQRASALAHPPTSMSRAGTPACRRMGGSARNTASRSLPSTSHPAAAGGSRCASTAPAAAARADSATPGSASRCVCASFLLRLAAGLAGAAAVPPACWRRVRGGGGASATAGVLPRTSRPCCCRSSCCSCSCSCCRRFSRRDSKTAGGGRKSLLSWYCRHALHSRARVTGSCLHAPDEWSAPQWLQRCSSALLSLAAAGWATSEGCADAATGRGRLLALLSLPPAAPPSGLRFLSWAAASDPPASCFSASFLCCDSCLPPPAAAPAGVRAAAAAAPAPDAADLRPDGAECLAACCSRQCGSFLRLSLAGCCLGCCGACGASA